MRITAAGLGCVLVSVLLMHIGEGKIHGQNQPQPLNHVIIPNPTPRPPDLKQEYDKDSKDQNKQKVLSVESQLRAREVWLESNQLLLLAQQLDQEIHSGGKAPSMASDAGKAAKIQKLAQSIQQKMKSD